MVTPANAQTRLTDIKPVAISGLKLEPKSGGTKISAYWENTHISLKKIMAYEERKM